MKKIKKKKQTKKRPRGPKTNKKNTKPQKNTAKKRGYLVEKNGVSACIRIYHGMYTTLLRHTENKKMAITRKFEIPPKKKSRGN